MGVETFDRADDAVYAGAGAALWETTNGTGGASSLIVVSNQLAISTSNSGGLSKISVPADFRFAIQVPTKSSGMVSVNMLTSNAGTGTASGFGLGVDSPGSGAWAIERLSSGSWSGLATGTHGGGSIGGGEWFMFDRSDETIRGRINNTGSPVLTNDAHWDTVVTASAVSVDKNGGVIEVYASHTTTRFDNLSWVEVADDPPVNTVAPAVTGIARVGETLSCSTGTWDNNPTGYTYQWQRLV